MGAVLPSRQGSLNLDEEQFEDADSHLPLSRQGSLHRSTLSIDKNHNNEDKKWNRSLSFLRRGSSRRRKKGNDGLTYTQGRDGHLQPGGQPPSRSPSPAFGRRSSITPPRGRSPTPIHRDASPHRHPHHDLNFSEAASGMAEFVHEKHENKRRGRSRAKKRDYSPARSRSPVPNPVWRHGPTPHSRSRSHSPVYPSVRLDRPSRTPSPSPSTPTQSEYYGTSHLHYRSRSPSPSSVRSLPIVQRRPGGGRRLPPTPTKPSTLRLDIISSDPINFPDVSHSPTVPQPSRSPGSINFPKLSASPTHTSLINQQQHPPWRERTPGHSLSVDVPSMHHRGEPVHVVPTITKPDGNYSSTFAAPPPHGQRVEPLSFEAAAAIGRGSRHLPSPLPNGYKPGQRERERLQKEREPLTLVVRTNRKGPQHHDPDEDDWC